MDSIAKTLEPGRRLRKLQVALEPCSLDVILKVARLSDSFPSLVRRAGMGQHALAVAQEGLSVHRPWSVTPMPRDECSDRTALHQTSDRGWTATVTVLSGPVGILETSFLF